MQVLEQKMYGNAAIHRGDIKISIVICSIKPERCEKTLVDISKTIGASYETIVFNNLDYNWGICKVYNHCAEKAASPYLCFMHEDVYIKTKNWGKTIVEFMEERPDCGVVGFAGSLEVKRNFSWWWSGERVININDGLSGKNDEYWKFNYKNHHYINPKAERYSRVLCIDGMMQFVKKSVWSEMQYDEKSFTGFHFYDSDFSLAVAQKYKNYALLNMDVFHDSNGTINHEYIKDMFVFQNKWHKKLPLYLENPATKTSRTGIIHSELRGMVEIYNFCKEKKIKAKKYVKQMRKINGNYIIPLFYSYYWTKKACGKIIKILKEI